jgi:hypothetical protein
MPIPTKKLRVLPNPWTYIDHKGRPAGRFPYEATDGVMPDGRTIGSRIASAEEVQAAKSVRIAGFTFQLQPADHDIQIAYDDEPVTVGNTAYYRKAIASGQLIAADVETANVAGIKSKYFESYARHVDGKREAAIAEFDAANGDGAFAHFENERAEAAKAKAVSDAEAKKSPQHAEKSAAEEKDPVKPIPHSTLATSQAAEQAIRKGDK